MQFTTKEAFEQGEIQYPQAAMKLTPKRKKPKPLSCKDFRQKKKFDSFRYSRIKTIELIWWSRGESRKSRKPPVFELVAGTVHRTVPFRWVRFPSSEYHTDKKNHPFGWLFLLVEPRGIEPLSESNLEGTSPGADCYLHSLIPAGTNTLRESVAS